MLGPRLEPILTALLILAHMVLPIVHGAAFYVVYSYYKTPRIILPADAGNVGAFCLPHGSLGSTEKLA